MVGTTEVKGIYDTWEKAASAWFEAWAKSPAFIATMGKMLEAQLGLKGGANRMVDGVLEAWRVPSSRDLESLAERIATIEERLAAIESALGVKAKAGAAAGAGAKETK